MATPPTYTEQIEQWAENASADGRHAAAADFWTRAAGVHADNGRDRLAKMAHLSAAAETRRARLITPPTRSVSLALETLRQSTASTSNPEHYRGTVSIDPADAWS